MLLFCNSNNRPNKTKRRSKWKRRSGFISQSIEHFGNEETIVSYPKTETDHILIRKALEGNEFLSNILQEEQIQHFVDCMFLKAVKRGETLIKEGDRGSYLYISNEGTYEVTIGENTPDVLIYTFDDVRVFGELAILYSAKRRATVKCLDDGSVWVLDCRTFKKLIIKTAFHKQEEIVSILKKVPKLNTSTKETLYQVANLLQEEFFATSESIITEGECVNKLYIIRAGSASVFKDGIKVTQLNKGDYFGELALLTDEVRRATVIANDPGAECLTLAKKDFIDHFGGVEEFNNLKIQQVHGENVIEYSELNLKDFKTLDRLGTGGFGKVELIQHKSYKDQTFALKSIKKMDIIGRSYQDQVYNEKNLQMACRSEFIVRLYRTYKDSKYIYLLLEVCLGGDLWNLLHRQKKHCFEESAAKFYSACVLEALAYLHERGILYRDLKPENVMVHDNGYLKITDFGFAKKTDSTEKTYTFVGTAEYVAPEVILNKGYSKGVDYWAFGVLIYELLTGRTPFRSNDPGHLKTYKLILRGIDHAVFPYFVSGRARALVKKLCAHAPSDRLGCQKGGIEDIRNHPWFSAVNWYQLRHFEIDPPFTPSLLNDVDTKYFEESNGHLRHSVPMDDWSDWDDDF